LLSPLSHKRCYAEFYVGKIRRIRIGRCSEATRGFTMVSFTETVSRRNTFVGGTCAPPSALLVSTVIIIVVIIVIIIILLTMCDVGLSSRKPGTGVRYRSVRASKISLRRSRCVCSIAPRAVYIT